MSNIKDFEIIIQCPHCDLYIYIEKLNCHIFRHGTFISNGEQIPPHSSENDCNIFKNNKLIWGCSKPFKITKLENNTYLAEKCDYI